MKIKNVSWYNLTLVGSLVCVIFLFSGQVTLSAKVLKLTNDLKSCSQEFQAVLKERSGLVDLTDELALKDDEAQMKFNREITSPPPEIAQLAIYDPVRVKWFQSNFINFNKTVDSINTQRRKALQGRAQNPYPKIACGR